MNLLRVIFAFIWVVLRTLLFGWIVGLWRVAKEIYLRCRRAYAKKHLPGRQGKASNKPCVPLSDPAMKRPDPLIYDQYYLMSLGFGVTWDNPDIWLEEGGVVVPSDQLRPDTLYDVVARIWNGSTEAPVVGLPVDFSFLSFGAGVKSNPLLPGPNRVMINLDVKGGPGAPAIARTKWRTPPVAGHFCLQVSFSWIDDANPNNNLGQENTQVGTSKSPVNFEFQLRNAWRQAQEFRFETDTYTIPPLPACGSAGRLTRIAESQVARAPWSPVKVPPQHDRRNYPLPAGWTIAFVPDSPRLEADEEMIVVATVTPVAGFKGRQPINVHAFSGTSLVGGMTFYIEGS